MTETDKKNRERERAIERLVDGIMSEQQITCSKCAFVDVDQAPDEYYAANKFYRSGWRVTIHGNAYCPKCSKK